MEKLKPGGLTLANKMIPWMTPAGTANASFSNAIYGRPGRDKEIEKVPRVTSRNRAGAAQA